MVQFSSRAQFQVMSHLWIPLAALLLLLPMAQALNSPEEHENQVLKHTEEEVTKSEASH